MKFAVGPFIGSFKDEVLYFRPYLTWILNVESFSDIFVSTYQKSFFLYSDFSNINLIDNQKGEYTISKVKNREINQYSKIFKSKILNDFNILKKELEVYSKIDISTNNLIYSKIDFSDLEEKNSILYLYEDEEPIVNNSIFEYIDVNDFSYENVIRKITEANIVVCKAGFWTFICNMQRKKVLSWGKNIVQFKEEGIWRLGNKDCKILYHENGYNNKLLINSILNFVETKGE